MFKFKVMTVVLLAVVFIVGRAYSQQEMTASGKVVKVDVEGGVINLQTDSGEMVFYLSAEANLYHFSHHMSVIEMKEGDPVTIQYTSMSGKNNVISLVDNKTDYGK